MGRFEAGDNSNYTALLLSADGQTIYVGAREVLFALDSSVSFQPDGPYVEVRRDWWTGQRGGGEAWASESRVLT